MKTPVVNGRPYYRSAGAVRVFKKNIYFLVKPHVFSFETFSQRQGSEEFTQLKTLRELKHLIIHSGKIFFRGAFTSKRSANVD